MTGARSFLDLDPQGWSVLRRSTGSRVVYVSSSQGDDANDGLSPETPKKTLGEGMKLVRNHQPDWLLLRGGDVFEDEHLNVSNRFGKSADEPFVISSYGPGRALLRNGKIYTVGGSGRSVRYLVITALEFYQSQRDPASPDFVRDVPAMPGISLTTEGQDILIEDCVVRFATGSSIQGFSNTGTPGRIANVVIRRNVFADSYSNKGHSQGLFINNVDGLLIEENVFDHNGWRADQTDGTGRTMFNHNVYIQTSTTNAIVRGNVFARGASHGLQQRSGGICEDNLFIRNALAIYLGVGTQYDAPHRVRRNVVLEPDDISPTTRRGFGAEIYPTLDGIYEDNVFADHRAEGKFAAIHLHDTRMDARHHNNGENPLPAGTRGSILLNRNFVRDWPATPTKNTLWNGAISRPASEEVWSYYTVGELIVDGRDKQGRPVPLLDPARSLKTFLEAQGRKGEMEEFLHYHRTRPRGQWEPQWAAKSITKYIRAGFVRLASGD